MKKPKPVRLIHVGDRWYVAFWPAWSGDWPLAKTCPSDSTRQWGGWRLRFSPSRSLVVAKRCLGADQKLLDLMGDLSEEFSSASWCDGLEVELWREIIAPGTTGYDLTVEQRTDLLRSAARAGGWWRWDDGGRGTGYGGPRFVPLAEWAERYAASPSAEIHRTV